MTHARIEWSMVTSILTPGALIAIHGRLDQDTAADDRL
jgi:hypothetical protein